MRAIDPDTMPYEDKKKALNAINLIKKKRDGTIKGRKCADGSKQHLYLKEYERVASPTVSLEELFTTILIDILKGMTLLLLISQERIFMLIFLRIKL